MVKIYALHFIIATKCFCFKKVRLIISISSTGVPHKSNLFCKLLNLNVANHIVFSYERPRVKFYNRNKYGKCKHLEHKNAFYSETFSGQNLNQYLTSVHLFNIGSN